MSYIPAALASLQSSTALLSTLHFHSTNALSAALLAPEAAFETHLIRDAAPHELALFEPASSVQPVLLDSADLSRAGDGERWTATKRAQPKQVGGWEKASPLKQKKGAAGQQEDPLRCLKAAERLLQV